MSATPPRDDNEKWYSIYLIINLTFEEEEEKITLKKTTKNFGPPNQRLLHSQTFKDDGLFPAHSSE